jgi:hypothetical protein
MRPLPDELRCKATVGGDAFPGILLIAKFGVTAKNSYAFIFGPTDSAGVALLSKADVISQANEQLNLALMDYQPLERVFSGDIGVTPVSHEDARAALSAYALFRGNYQYPEDHEEILKAALKNPLLSDVSSICITRLS